MSTVAILQVLVALFAAGAIVWVGISTPDAPILLRSATVTLGLVALGLAGLRLFDLFGVVFA